MPFFLVDSLFFSTGSVAIYLVMRFRTRIDGWDRHGAYADEWVVFCCSAGTSMISLIIPPKVRSLRKYTHETRIPNKHLKRLGSNLSCVRNVNARIRYSVQHQVARQQTVRPRRNHFHPAASQTLHASASEWSGLVRRYDLDRRRQGKEGFFRF